MPTKKQPEILCWTAELQRDEANMAQVSPESTSRPLFAVTVEGDASREVGTAYNFRIGKRFTCTVAIDQVEWRKCLSDIQNGVAVYAGPFKILGGVWSNGNSV